MNLIWVTQDFFMRHLSEERESMILIPPKNEPSCCQRQRSADLLGLTCTLSSLLDHHVNMLKSSDTHAEFQMFSLLFCVCVRLSVVPEPRVTARRRLGCWEVTWQSSPRLRM